MTSVERSTVVAPCSAACPGAEPEPVAVAVDHRVVKAGAPKPIEDSGRIDRLEEVTDVQRAAGRSVLTI